MTKLIYSLATGAMLLAVSSTLFANPHDKTYTGRMITDEGDAGVVLTLDESTGQASMDLVGFPYWPDDNDYPFYLPLVTLTGAYSYDSNQESISFNLQWDGTAHAINDSDLTVRRVSCRTASGNLNFQTGINYITGPVEMAGKFHHPEVGDRNEPYTSGFTLEVDAPDSAVTPTPTPIPASSDSNFVFSHLDGTQWEQSVGYPALFDAPIFSDDELGLGLYVNDPTRTFGYWQTINQLDALPAGRYSLKIFISPDPSSISGRYPEMRIRVFQGDNSLSKMAVFAQVSTDTAVPPYVEVVWNSDGVSPWRVAIDILSFVPDYDGGYLITAITNDEI